MTTSNSIKEKLYTIIFEADTPAGKYFDLGLIICILSSVLVVMLDSVEYIQFQYGSLLTIIEWDFTFYLHLNMHLDFMRLITL